MSPDPNAKAIIVECKNYACDPENRELDQISGRFSRERGKFGLLIARRFQDRGLFVNRCRDTARDGRGYVLPLGDQEIVTILKMIALKRRWDIEPFLDRLFAELLT